MEKREAPCESYADVSLVLKFLDYDKVQVCEPLSLFWSL
jgi:hypothetical protein